MSGRDVLWPVGTLLVCRTENRGTVTAWVYRVDRHVAVGVDGADHYCSLMPIVGVDDTESHVAATRCPTCGHVPAPDGKLHLLADDDLRRRPVVVEAIAKAGVR